VFARTAAVSVLLVPAVACGAGREAASGGRQQAVVTRVVDGDTVWLRGVGAGPVPRGQAAKVRVLDIDTPEVAAYGGQAGCWGDRAWAYAREVLAPGTQVDVLAGPRPRDRYGRLLLHVFLPDGTSYAEDAVRAGHARVLLIGPEPQFAVRIRAAEREAREARRGLWGACGPE
jgi:micrococcal nuclease